MRRERLWLSVALCAGLGAVACTGPRREDYPDEEARPRRVSSTPSPASRSSSSSASSPTPSGARPRGERGPTDPQALRGGADPRLAAAWPAAERELFLNGEASRLIGLICEREPDPGEASLGGEYPQRSSHALSRRERVEAVEALSDSILEGGAMALCFEPHHALEARRGALRVQLVICFACSQFQRRGSLALASPSAGEVAPEVDEEGLVYLGGGALSSRAEALLNRLLGQVSTIPPGEVEGRPLVYWLARAEAAPPEGVAEQLGILSGLLRAPLSLDQRAELNAALAAQGERDPAGLGAALSVALRGIVEAALEVQRPDEAQRVVLAAGLRDIRALARTLPTRGVSVLDLASQADPLIRDASPELRGLRELVWQLLGALGEVGLAQARETGFDILANPEAPRGEVWPRERGHHDEVRARLKALGITPPG